MNEDSPHIAHLDGRPATTDDLAPLAFSGHAHFTAAQIRDGRIRGLDLHLERLRSASVELFGRALPEDVVRAHLRTALAAAPAADLSLTATVSSTAGEFTATEADLALLVRTGPPSTGPGGPLALAAVEHERFLPHIKHVGEVAKTHLLRQAAADGFDDAAFLDREGRFSEATIWNLVFWDGEAVVWPEARILTGTTLGIVRRQLDRLGVGQRTAAITPDDLPALAGAAVMNSWTPGVPVHRIGTTELPAAPRFLETLHQAYTAEPPTAP
ncbi:aminotransferase class IV [Streptomyces sp. ID03-2B]|uniref:aminotransferase class IV n=1 Tax=Streptomyces TaxID=1883 RepID=UPI0022504439|nr:MULTISPECIES: aminotransferase class IV [Streptomyces]MCX4707893.1 aminotransferase class IV [Streptomyces griseus]MDX3596051.1 aminotransferase class IV [Streptomyces sp. ID03-2B]